MTQAPLTARWDGPSLLAPRDRLRFERRRLPLRLALLFAPIALLMGYGPAVAPIATLAAAAVMCSFGLTAFLLWRHPRALLRFQLLLRLLDVVLICIVLSSFQRFVGYRLFDLLYVLPVVAAAGTHGAAGAFLISMAAAAALFASRIQLDLGTVGPVSSLLQALDGVAHGLLFAITGTMLTALMRASGEVVARRERKWHREVAARNAQLERALTDLRESEERYRIVSELTSDFAYAFRVAPDGTSECEWVTEACSRITGIPRDQLVACNGWTELIHPDDLALGKRWWRSLVAGQPGTLEVRIVTRRGETRLLRAHARPVLDETGTGVARIYGAAQDITEQDRWERALAYQALHDALTDLPNRFLLRDRLRQAIAAANRANTTFALLIVDLNHFKDVNDSLGHHAGDAILKRVGRRLRRTLREPDTVARLGGDEFAVLLPETDVENAARVAETLLRALEKPFRIGGRRLGIGVSIGITLFPEHGADAEALLRCADSARYLAKGTGSGCTVYSSDQDRHGPSRLELIAELRRAIEQDELTLHYQPKVDVKRGGVIGVEALLRWQHRERGLVPPDQFIPLAEQAGLIKPLTRWVLREALRQCGTWRAQGLDLPVAVNLSARSLHDPDLPDMVADQLQASAACPSWLKLEVTETSVMTDTTQAMHVLRRLRDMGMELAVDDFGTGYSSLAYLKRLPVGQLKIDKGFVRGAIGDENDAVIVRAMIDLGHSLGLTVVAEGVENRATWDLLAAAGCDEAQGYYIGRAMPAANLPDWVNASSRRVSGASAKVRPPARGGRRQG